MFFCQQINKRGAGFQKHITVASFKPFRIYIVDLYQMIYK